MYRVCVWGTCIGYVYRVCVQGTCMGTCIGYVYRVRVQGMCIGYAYRVRVQGQCICIGYVYRVRVTGTCILYTYPIHCIGYDVARTKKTIPSVQKCSRRHLKVKSEPTFECSLVPIRTKGGRGFTFVPIHTMLIRCQPPSMCALQNLPLDMFIRNTLIGHNKEKQCSEDIDVRT